VQLAIARESLIGKIFIADARYRAMPTLKANGIEIYYEMSGSGEPLLLIGGLGADVRQYRKTASSLSQNFTVISFDNRGAGGTDKPDIPYTIEMMADDTAGLLAGLKIGRAHVVGMSLGGRIAMALALRHPSMVKSLVLTSTFASQPKDKLPFRYNALVFLAGALRPFSKRIIPYYAFKRQLEASRSYGCAADLPKIAVPTLVLHGKKDTIAPFSMAEEIHAGIKGSKLIAFEGGHTFSMRQNEIYAATIKEFLAGID
jgi:pimeloyl-ACP methyl ester carboxylesterase